MPDCHLCGHDADAHELRGFGEPPPIGGWRVCPADGCACWSRWSMAIVILISRQKADPLFAEAERWEPVLHASDYWCAPRAGITTFGGRPHFFRATSDPSVEEWHNGFVLTPMLDAAAADRATEAARIFADWSEVERGAFYAGDEVEDGPRYAQLTADLPSFPDGVEGLPVRAFFRYAGGPPQFVPRYPVLEVCWIPEG